MLINIEWFKFGRSSDSVGEDHGYFVKGNWSRNESSSTMAICHVLLLSFNLTNL